MVDLDLAILDLDLAIVDLDIGYADLDLGSLDQHPGSVDQHLATLDLFIGCRAFDAGEGQRSKAHGLLKYQATNVFVDFLWRNR